MSDILIPRPIYTNTFDFKDADTHFLATYLFTEVNKTFQEALGGDIIKTCRDFNDNFIPIVDFPVLKVYPTRENDSADIAPYISTQFTISYAVAYTQKPKIGSVCKLVAKEIRRLLKNASTECYFQVDYSSPIDIEYEDFISPDNVVYKYVTITVNIFTQDTLESSKPG